MTLEQIKEAAFNNELEKIALSHGPGSLIERSILNRVLKNKGSAEEALDMLKDYRNNFRNGPNSSFVKKVGFESDLKAAGEADSKNWVGTFQNYGDRSIHGSFKSKHGYDFRNV